MFCYYIIYCVFCYQLIYLTWIIWRRPSKRQGDIGHVGLLLHDAYIRQILQSPGIETQIELGQCDRAKTETPESYNSSTGR